MSTAALASAPPHAAVLGERVLSAKTAEEVVRRGFSSGFDRWAEQVAACGSCARPVRLVGSATTVDAATGEVLSTYDSAAEPDGVLYVRCGTRRAALCPSCSREYKGDMWHLLAAGASGGMKGVPTSVAAHPQVFATLTAPSFGAVHTTRTDTQGAAGRCHPRRRGVPPVCRHGAATSCGRVHPEDDPRLGQPLCPQCYDYTAHVVWQWWAPELWRRFTIALTRELAAHLGVPQRHLREVARLSFAKVAEFQRRAVVHFHAIIRLDGPTTPGATGADAYPAPVVAVDADALVALVHTAAARVTFDAPPVEVDGCVRRLRFGRQVDARPVHSRGTRDGDDDGHELHPDRVAAYVAKYATKACEDFGIPAGITGPAAARFLGCSDHVVHLIATAAGIAKAARIAPTGEPAYEGLGRWVHMLGFRGHFSSKSRTYSTTMGRLRSARRRWSLAQLRARRTGQPAPVVDVDAADDPAEDSTLVMGSWQLEGIGWLTAGDAALAAESAALAREHAARRAAARRAQQPPAGRVA